MMRAISISVLRWAIPLVAVVLVGATLAVHVRGDNCEPGIIVTIAGNGVAGYSGDGGPATEASLRVPCQVAIGQDGSTYIVEYENHRVRKVDPSGLITTVAGNGVPAYSGDGGPATAASLHHPKGVTVGPDGTLYITDSGNHRIRRVLASGVITTVAGSGGATYAGDGGPATAAGLNFPRSVAFSADGGFYIADTNNNRVRWVSPDGIITTVAGTGEAASYGDGGPAVEAALNWPYDVAVGSDGSVYVADVLNNRVRRIDPTGIITTVAGTGDPGYSGDGGPAVEARLLYPYDVATDVADCLYISDKGNNRIRKVDQYGMIVTVAGTGEPGYSGDGGPADEADLNAPEGVTAGPDGDLYIADSLNSRVRKVCGGPPELCLSLPGPSWHMITVPWVCVDPAPAAVFDELRPPLAPWDMLHMSLHRYDHDAQGYVTYNHYAPTPFGLVAPGDGYWLWLYDDVTVCYRATPPPEPVTVHFPTAGWYLFGSPRAVDVPLDICIVCHGGECLPFPEAAYVYIQDPLLWYDPGSSNYVSCGVCPIDADHYLRAFRGYWLCTFVDDVTMEIPPP